jgi:hypothetical protein
MALGARHFVAAAALAAVTAYAALYGSIYAPPPIHSDGYSYFVYLPSVFIYHDVTLEKLASEWYGGPYPAYTGLRRWPTTGHWVNLHPIGTAMLMVPFFLVSDLLSVWSNLPRDGFSLYYQHGAGLAAIAYFLLGLTILRRLLIRDFSEGVVLATLVCITWGTNLFHYAVFDGTFSHVYAFCLVCVWWALVDQWWERPTVWRSAAIGAVAALNVLVRHTNLIFALVLPLYGITRWSDVRARIVDLRDRWRPLAVAGAAGLATLAPQLLLYKWATGQWFINAYATHDMSFSFGSPHLLAVLFSTQKGLFFWSPILLLSVGGVWVAAGRARALIVPAVVVFALQTWLIASWPQWQFGSTFGHRGFTDALPLAAPFVASAFAWSARHRPAATLVGAFASIAVLLSVAQMIQYWIGILPAADTTWEQYRHLFLRFR